MNDDVAALGKTLRRLDGNDREADAWVRRAAWVARSVGRGELAPLFAEDLPALTAIVRPLTVARGGVLFSSGQRSAGVWIVRQGQIELVVGSGRRSVAVYMLRPGDVDGDIPLLLDTPLPYSGRALSDAVCLFLPRADFDSLLSSRPAIARRWLSSVTMRLIGIQVRILSLLGRSLNERAAQFLLDEAADGHVQLPQRTVAAMLGVQRPSLNKVLKDFEREGLITVRYAGVSVLDAPALARRAR